MTTQKTYTIEAGAIVTKYEGATEQETLDNFAKDAGYKDYADLVGQHSEVDSIKKSKSK